MPLLHKFPDPLLNLTLEVLLGRLGEYFTHRFLSLILYGSVVFNDLAPGYGDLDFLALIEDDLVDEDCNHLIEIRKLMRSDSFGPYASMLEGAFLPRCMLDPDQTGRAFWWGTTAEREWPRNQLGWLALYTIRERSLLVWGEDLRREIPRVTKEHIIDSLWDTFVNIQEYGKGGGLHAIDWLLTAARGLLLLKEGRLSSKSEAAEWAIQNASGSWRLYLPPAKELRCNPSKGNSQEAREWLAKLTVPIQEAGQELRRELESQT